MAVSTYLGNMILNSVLRGQPFTLPTSVFLALHTDDPGNSGINEVTLVAWPAYARVDIDGGTTIDAGWSAAAAKATSNLKQLLYSVNDGAGAVDATHYGIWDAATGGNLFLYGALTASKNIGVSDQLIFNTGSIDISVT